MRRRPQRSTAVGRGWMEYDEGGNGCESMKKSGVVAYQLRLDAWFRRDGRVWLAWCPAIRVMTQADTKKAARSALREAVELWFESSIDRGVLDRALRELGFSGGEGGLFAEHADVVQVVRGSAARRGPIAPKFDVAHERGSDYIQGVIPAHVAVQELRNTVRASA